MDILYPYYAPYSGCIKLSSKVLVRWMLETVSCMGDVLDSVFCMRAILDIGCCKGSLLDIICCTGDVLDNACCYVVW